MTQYYSSNIYDLIDQAESLERGPAQVALLEEAVRLADSHQDVGLGFEARDQLLDAATFSGEPDKLPVAFSWCLSQADRDPAQFPEANLLWKYKWVIRALSSFPQITKEQIDASFADMTQRFERAGSTLQPIYLMQFEQAVDMGDKKLARKFYQLWKKTPRDWLSNCPACEQDEEVWYQRFLNKDEKTLEAARPILAGSMRCQSVPHDTYAKLLLPLVRLGRLEQAAQFHRRGYRMISNNPVFLKGIGDHIEFLVLTENLARAAKLLEKHLGWALVSPSLDKRFYFYLAVQFLLERLQSASKTSLKLRLPNSFPALEKDGHYDLDKLHVWFAGQCQELANRFDRRNETDYYRRQIDNLRKLHKIATPFPINQ